MDLADQLSRWAQDVEELRAARVRTPSGRYRLLRILAAFDVFCECADGRFENTELSKTLWSEMTTVVGAYDFAGITTFVNVGGGHGEQCERT